MVQQLKAIILICLHSKQMNCCCACELWYHRIKWSVQFIITWYSKTIFEQPHWQCYKRQMTHILFNEMSSLLLPLYLLFSLTLFLFTISFSSFTLIWSQNSCLSQSIRLCVNVYIVTVWCMCALWILTKPISCKEMFSTKLINMWKVNFYFLPGTSSWQNIMWFNFWWKRLVILLFYTF